MWSRSVGWVTRAFERQWLCQPALTRWRDLDDAFSVRGSLALCLFGIPLLAACGPSPIRVVGVVRQSSEMRPLPAVPLGGYQQLRVLVLAAPGQSVERYGSADCGFTRLEGTSEVQDLRNAACVPVETLNEAVGIVRQRLRAYGIVVARDAAEPHDYTVEVLVTGEAPRKAESQAREGPRQGHAEARRTPGPRHPRRQHRLERGRRGV